jgi:very-short-patch-repair endonuclease
MGHRIPDELKSGHFSVSYAAQLGVSRRDLRGPAWRRVSRGVYVWAAREMDRDLALAVLLESLPPRSVLSGLTAARLHGLDVPAPPQPEVIIPLLGGVSGRAHANVRRVRLDPTDATTARGLPVTTPIRTCFDLAGRLPLVEGVVIVDMALYTSLVELDAFRGYISRHGGVAGVAGARRALEHAEPKAESPMETRLRLLLVKNGLPRPEAQVPLYDRTGAFVGRPDLYYRDARLAIEYDGENHRDRLVADNRRQNGLQAIGVTLLRYTAPDLFERPQAIAGEVRAELARHPPFAGKRRPNGASSAPFPGKRPA